MMPVLLAWIGVAFADDPAWDPVLDEAYRFCHVPGAQADEAREWCDLLDDIPPDRCPGLRETCDGAPPQQDMADFMEAIRGCGASGEGGKSRGFAPPAEPEPSRPMSCDEPMDCNAPPEAGMLPAVFRWVIAILVGLGVLVLLRLLITWWGARLDREVRTTPSEPVVVAIDDPQAVPELPSGDLLSAARRALAEGRTGDAVLLARGAALRRLGELGRLSLHRARTDREYVRAVRKDVALHEPLREVIRAVEVHRWGGRPVSIDMARAALGAAERLVGTGLLLIAVVVGLEADASAQSRYGPYGDAALRELYARGGYEASWRLRGLQSLDGTTDVVVVDLSAIELLEEDQQALADWVAAGGVLITAGDATAVFPQLGEHVVGWWDLEVDGEALGGAPPTDELLDAAMRRARAGRDAPPLLPVPRFADGADGCFRIGADVRSWVEIDLQGHTCSVVAALSHGEGGVIAIADGRLLRNASLAVPRNEAFLIEAPYAGYDAGMWDLPLPARLELATRAGEDSQNPLTALANAKLLPVVLQLLGLGVLIAMWRGWPFGPLRDPPEEGRLAFGEHVRALGTRYARMGASRHALSAFSRLWLARLGPAGVAQAARRAGMDAERSQRLVEAVEDAAEHPEGKNRPEDLEIVEELWKVTRR